MTSEVAPNTTDECLCGCGAKTALAQCDWPEHGWVKGQPKRFIKGHQRRKSPVEYVVDAETGCWDWQRYTDRNGYGQRRINGRGLYAHRHAYETHVGPIPPGHDVHHACRNPRCVNPAHLEAMPRSEHGAMHGAEHG